MLFIATPTSYLACFWYEFGLTGLWIGYGLSAFILSVFYFYLLWRLDWEETALWASTNEDYSCNESSTSEGSSDIESFS